MLFSEPFINGGPADRSIATSSPSLNLVSIHGHFGIGVDGTHSPRAVLLGLPISAVTLEEARKLPNRMAEHSRVDYNHCDGDDLPRDDH